MLWNREWDKKTKANPRSLESFIAWLEQQPPEGRYDYCKIKSCLIAQWLMAVGDERYQLLSREVARLFGGNGDIIVHAEPWTFGAALARARAVMSSQHHRNA